ncbi:hypothetical protein JI666_09205 [Bacillus sp. NTK071]|uniref:hypothetical protein n=1 Tax=Bacillus sp. NTK071 TaxID=2802175 RepID=UPI001A8FDD21|nr:hypothetical protein [Bacillus sp. NTK071]MBN8208921.1 hypothetical protein [Bacillus sp. NTK071]
MGQFLGIIGILGLLVCIVLAVVSLIRKNGKAKKYFGFAALSFVMFVIGVAVSPTEEVSSDPVTEVEAEVEEEVKTEEEIAQEKKEAEEKAKEEEAREKEEAEAEKKAAEELAEKKANAEPIEFKQLEKNPDRYTGEYVKYTGEIVQIIESDDYTNIRLAVTKDSYGYSFDEIIYIEYDGLTEFVEEDVVTIYGTVYGSHDYTSQAGYELSIPGVLADEITE